MAIGRMSFYSHEMNRNVEFRFLIPEGPNPYLNNEEEYKRDMKTLYLLHGHGNGSEEWLTGSIIKDLSYRYNLAVIMPNGENSFYLNQSLYRTNYANYVGEELVSYTRKLFGFSDRREDTFVGGISMGGFGALHTGLEYSHNFSKIMALSSALILYNLQNQTEDYKDGFGNYDNYEAIFGDLRRVMRTRVNPEQIILDLKKENKKIPDIFMACGTEDFLLEHNRTFHAFLEKEGIAHQYYESAGDHNFQFWNPYAQKAVEWMVKENIEE